MTNPLVPWSHTKLENFEQCPKKAYHTYVLGEKEVFKSAQQESGINSHKALEDRLIGNKPLPAALAAAEPMAGSLKAKEGEGWSIYAEYKMSVDHQYRPIDYWDKSGRLFARSAADVLAVSPDQTRAVLVDWKDGKRREKPVQIERMALMTFAHFPKVDRVDGAFAWLKEFKFGPVYHYWRQQEPELRANVQKILDKAQDCSDKGDWPENPSPLCSYCHVKSCRFNKS